MLLWFVAIAGAYLLGAVPFGVLIARSRGVDIRAHGSGNTGATNVGRVLGRPWGLLCFALDVLKGAVPVLGAGLAAGLVTTPLPDIPAADAWFWFGTAVAAVLGHMFSIFLRGGGGKGVATSFGALLAMWPLTTIPALAAFAAWAVVVRTSRYMSLGSMSGAVALPLAVAILGLIAGDEQTVFPPASRPALIVTTALAVLVIARHRDNIRRLLQGTESRMGASRATEPDRSA